VKGTESIDGKRLLEQDSAPGGEPSVEDRLERLPTLGDKRIGGGRGDKNSPSAKCRRATEHWVNGKHVDEAIEMSLGRRFRHAEKLACANVGGEGLGRALEKPAATFPCWESGTQRKKKDLMDRGREQ